ncbi:MAG: hypothetical protein EOO20_09630 [Chryseobacterium sp.]|nr:MAG: hypothetical protein EOO20_09630 [Chryseobacterium sp.]
MEEHKYIIVYSNKMHDMDQVNTKIKEGYKPLGGVAIDVTNNMNIKNIPKNATIFTFLQSMIKD